MCCMQQWSLCYILILYIADSPIGIFIFVFSQQSLLQKHIFHAKRSFRHIKIYVIKCNCLYPYNSMLPGWKMFNC